MKIFNANGEKVYQEWIQTFCRNPETPYVNSLLSDPGLCEDVGSLPDPIFNGVFKTKYAMISRLKEYIEDCLSNVSQDMSEQRRVWDSFAYRMLKVICGKDKQGRWNPGHPAKYMIWDHEAGRFTLYQRHLIYTPYRFVATNEAAIRPFFEEVEPWKGTGFEEEIGARQEFVENPNVLALFNRLYVNREGKPMRGFFAMAKKVKGTNVKYCKPGSIRRLMAVLMQFKNTYDIMSCSPDKMMELLPDEFSKWEADKK